MSTTITGLQVHEKRRSIGLIQRHAFTFVELLVLIAILSVLSALLLPALQNAAESARRTSCANNMRQVYAGAANYADDFNGFLSGGSVDGLGTFHLRIDHNLGNVLFFFNSYLQVPVYLNSGAVATDFIPDRSTGNAYKLGTQKSRRVLSCPGCTDDHPQRIAYAIYGLGTLTYSGAFPIATYYSPRFNRLTQQRSGYPQLFAMDQLYMFPSTVSGQEFQFSSANNHANNNPQGMNICAGDGSVEWVGLKMGKLMALGSSNRVFPTEYWTKLYYRPDVKMYTVISPVLRTTEGYSFW